MRTRGDTSVPMYFDMENLGFGPDPSDPMGHPATNGIHQYNKPKTPVLNQDPEKIITVLGSGDYGRALSGRLVQSGYTVYIGSRNPSRPKLQNMVQKTGAVLMNQDDALRASQMIVVAVGRDHYDSLPLNLLKNKILIDVSNNTELRKGPHYRSNAEYLQGLTPDSKVVKSFNVLSAYTLENGGLQGSKEVYLASDFADAKGKVSEIVRACGYNPVDWGMLKAARDIEDVPLKLMPSWKRPVAVVFGLFVVLWIFALISFQFCANAQYGDWTANWKHIANQNFNRVIAILALWTLAFCYLPGLIAAYIQLWRGTKYSRFPKWMDDWLKMRKQLGLLMLGMACVHACMSVAYVTPQTLSWVYEPATYIEANVRVNKTSTETIEKVLPLYDFHFNWRGELFLTLGALATCLVVVLGITSLPSVTSVMSWREFTFVQSKLGWVALIMASLHDVFLGWNFMFEYRGCFGTTPIGPQYALYPTFICVALKLPLLLPCVDNHLQKIRRGYERKPQVPQDSAEKKSIA